MIHLHGSPKGKEDCKRVHLDPNECQGELWCSDCVWEKKTRMHPLRADDASYQVQHHKGPPTWAEQLAELGVTARS
jgi:hypothetical protein